MGSSTIFAAEWAEGGPRCVARPPFSEQLAGALVRPTSCHRDWELAWAVEELVLATEIGLPGFVALEEGLGRLYLLLFYLAWGIAGGLGHAAYEGLSRVPMVGASGAVAGLIGAYAMAYGPMSKIRMLVVLGLAVRVYEWPASAVCLGWAGCQLLQWSHDPTGIAWGAPAGGFAAGALTMLFVRTATNCRLVEDRHGQLNFCGREQDSTVETEPLNYPVPSHCPHGGYALEEPPRLTANLLRCTACNRLIFLGPTHSRTTYTLPW